ncbi:MAG: hypothetical protein EPO24_11220 [Bacteroidetes bacterium]|nr:MAG: hypothetical protein EPO24_11220 [Bacteroidota bacterium]
MNDTYKSRAKMPSGTMFRLLVNIQIVCGMIAFPGKLISQNQEMQARILPFPEVSSLQGHYRSPSICKVDNNWVSFEIQSETGTKLFIGSMCDGKSYELSTITQKEEDGGAFSSGSSAGSIESNSELDWCPVKHGGTIWFVFASSGGVTGNKEIYLGNVKNPMMLYRLTKNSSVDYRPRWSPDGKSITIVSSRTGALDIYLFSDVWEMFSRLEDEMLSGNINASGETIDEGKWIERVTDTPTEDSWQSWSPDGNNIFYGTLKSPNDDKSAHRISVFNLSSRKNKTLLSDRKMIMMNPAISPDNKTIAFYKTGDKNDIKVNLIIGKIAYRDNEADTIKILWNQESIRKLSNVEGDPERGPLWGSNGNLYFINQINGFANYVYTIPALAFANVDIPEIQYIVLSDQNTSNKYSLQEVMLAEEDKTRKDVLFTAILGDKYGVYSTTPPPPACEQPPMPNITMAGYMFPLFNMLGNVGATEMGSGIAELFYQFPLDDEYFSLYCGIGNGYVNGSDLDDNKETWKFVSPFVYGIVMPGYRIPVANSLALTLRAGLGGLYVNSLNNDTKGIKFVVPAGVQIDYRLLSWAIFSTQAKFMYTSGDLDGLRSKLNPKFESDNIISITFGLGLIMPSGAR